MKALERYEAKPAEGEEVSCCSFNGIMMEVYDKKQEKVVGTFPCEAGYGTHLFHPFSHKGKDYALYSPDHTCSRVLALPSCEDVDGEISHSLGFCPVDFYVPTLEDFPYNKYLGRPEPDEYPFGFVSGCIWGDDRSWKLQFVDFKNLDEGKVTFDDRLGYFVLPHHLSIKEAIAGIQYDPSGEKYSYISLAQGVEKCIYDQEKAPAYMLESKKEESTILVEVFFNFKNGNFEICKYLLPIGPQWDDGILEDLYCALCDVHKLEDPEFKGPLYTYDEEDDENFVLPPLDEELKRFHHEICLVTGQHKPVKEKEDLVYNAWLEHRVNVDKIVKSLNAFYSIDVNVD